MKKDNEREKADLIKAILDAFVMAGAAGILSAFLSRNPLSPLLSKPRPPQEHRYDRDKELRQVWLQLIPSLKPLFDSDSNL